MADTDVCICRFEGSDMGLSPRGRRGLASRLQRRSSRLWKHRGRARQTREARYSSRVKKSGKYRPHRPHHWYCGCLQRFRAGGIFTGHRPPVGRYRPPRGVPTAYRLSNICAVCRPFSSVVVTAVGAVGIFLGLYLMVSERSTCILLAERDADAPRQRQHTPPTRTPTISCSIRG